MLNYLNWNLGSAQVDDKDAFWDLRAQSAHYWAVCAGPKTKKPRRPGEEVFETEQVKNEITSFREGQKSQIKLAVLNLDKSYKLCSVC